MAKKVTTRELGLILGVHLLKTSHLHYGLWSPDLPLRLSHLPQAQEAYCRFLIDHIPAGVRRVLDVGSGTGGLALSLRDAGYAVECLSPSVALNDFARERLGAGVPVHDTTLEDFQPAQPVELVVFSESFQYVKPAVALARAHQALVPGGHVLICDFFSRDTPDRGPLGGGHKLSAVLPQLEPAGFRLITDEDITDRLAPNLDLIDQIMQEQAKPMWQALGTFMRTNYPRIAALGARLFRKKLEKLHGKYFSGERNGANFAKYKSYRLMLLQRQDGDAGAA